MKKIDIQMTAQAEAINKAEVYRILRDMMFEAAKEHSNLPLVILDSRSSQRNFKASDDVVHVAGKIGFAPFSVVYRAHANLMAVDYLVYRNAVIHVPGANVPEVKNSEDAVNKAIKTLFATYNRDPERVKRTVEELERKRDMLVQGIMKEYAEKIEQAKKPNLTLIK